jgi:hypothetical protein
MTTTPEQIEAVARIIAYETGYTWGSSALDHDALREAAIAAIDAMRPFIRAEALEEAADVAEERVAYSTGQAVIRDSIATAIRALKEKKDV